MRKQVMVEQKVCDVCGSERSVYYTCERCGKDFCFEHKINMIECAPGVYHSGHGSSAYCRACYNYLTNYPTPLFLAYLEIAKLKKENSDFYVAFEVKRKVAEDNLISLYEASHL